MWRENTRPEVLGDGTYIRRSDRQNECGKEKGIKGQRNNKGVKDRQERERERMGGQTGRLRMRHKPTDGQKDVENTRLTSHDTAS